jgi:peptidyl-prolyl cis-trans isomerase SurA
MFLRYAPALIVLLSLFLVSCSPKHSEIVVAKYGESKIKMDEFERAYAKNVGGFQEAKNDSVQKLRNFLDLYLNFKMKLRDAEVRGYANDPALNSELTDYKKKVGVTYLLEKELVEPAVRDLYEKRKKELRVSHLMIRPDSTGWEQPKVLAQALLDSILNGANYEEMVMRHSQDQFSAPAGGDLFYITAGQLPYEFEDAAYRTKEGSVLPELAVTKYGYHIIKVTEVRERIPQVRASHILINFNNAEGIEDEAFAAARVDSVLAELNSGADFAEVAMKYTDDPSGKQQGGDLGFFERRQMVKEFDEAVFNLQVGEVSDVVKTSFGYHIIKLTDKRTYSPYEEEKENLKKIYKQTRYQAEYDALIDSLNTKFAFDINEEALTAIAQAADSAKLGTQWENFESVKNEVVVTYAGNRLTAEDLFANLSSNNEFVNRIITGDLLISGVNKIAPDLLLEEEALSLEKTNAEFAALMEDYRNGIYIFKLQEEEVWNKINVDSLRLHNFYEETKSNYVWGERVSFSEIFVRSDSAAKAIYDQLSAGADFNELAAEVTERPGYKEKAGLYPLTEIRSSLLATEVNKLRRNGEFTQPFQNAGGYSILRLNEKEASRIKTFDEARAEVSGAFQEAESKRLDQAYLDSLKRKYAPEAYYDKLESAFRTE